MVIAKASLKRKQLKNELIQKYGETKCFSDEIWLWLRYAYDQNKEKLKLDYDEYDNNFFYNEMETIYKKVRGETFWIGKNTIGMAAAIFYITCVMNGTPTTQRNIGDFFMISEVTVMNYFRILRIYLKL